MLGYLIFIRRVRDSMYVPVKWKLVISQIMAFSWVFFSIYAARPWIIDLANTFGYPLAILMVAGIALIPGWANAFLIAGLLLDRRPRYNPFREVPPVTLLVAAYNEEDFISETLTSILSQKYQGKVEIIVIDDGSVDQTVFKAREIAAEIPQKSNFKVKIISMPVNGGKSKALNRGLEETTHDIVVTIDADTYLYRDSLSRLVANLVDGPENTAAIAGTVLVRNSRGSLLARLQEWDYFLGIAVVKRIQSLYQGTLVAQGAFSVFRKSAIEEVGGWAERVGEDIVLTWAFHEKGYRVGYAENAFAFTNVPETYRQFFRQRRRWARGLIEAFKSHPRVLVQPKLVTPFILFNVLFPYLDFVYLTVFLPGLLAAIFFQYYAIVGLMTLLLLPLMITVNSIMFYHQRRIFLRHGLGVRKNIAGAILYMLTYQIVMTPASFLGYVSELLRVEKSWGTK
jgi:biofilm PGA synthesis N-glycosyltransferase PgaC